MEFTRIPNLDQNISRIGLGTWAIGGWMWGGTDEAESIATIHLAWDQGINFVDTAPGYGFGVSEKIVGKALKQYIGKSEQIIGKALKQYGKREQIVIATKVGLSWKDPQTVYRDSRKETILKEIEDSLNRLQVDYIDLYQVHWPDTLTSFSETADVLHQLLKQGKIRAIGVSNFSIEQVEAFQKGGPLHSIQSPFNLFESAIEKAELAYCLKNGIGFIGYGSLCRGLLTGKIGKDRIFKGDDLRKGDPKFQEPLYSQYLNCVEKLQRWVKQKHQRPLLALAIRWSLDKGTNIALWGVRRPEQLSELESVWGWKLTAQDFDQIDQIIKETISTPARQGSSGPPNRPSNA